MDLNKIKTIVHHPQISGFYASKHRWNDPVYALVHAKEINPDYDFKPLTIAQKRKFVDLPEYGGWAEYDNCLIVSP